MTLCTCQTPGIEAAAERAARTRAVILYADGLPGAIRALLTPPGQPCPRCEVVAAAERLREMELRWREHRTTGALRDAVARDLDNAVGALLRAVERLP